MIQSILMEYLPDGSLPVYEVEPGPYYVLEFNDALDLYVGDATWRPVHTFTPRMIIPLNIDADLVECQGQVPNWIARAQELPGNGTLVFSVRTMGRIGDGMLYVCAGLAYTPDPILSAAPLDGLDPAELIRHVLQGNRQHPIVQEVLNRHGTQLQEHHRYWQMACAARAIERKEAHVAYKRAARLLHGCLTPKQRREWHKKGHIHVNGQDGQLYRIEARPHQNVFLIEEGRAVMQLCVVSREKIPVPDLMLAQKLMLESSIEDFMRLANRWDLRNHRDPRNRERIIPRNFFLDDGNVLLRVPQPLPELGLFNVEGLDRIEVEEPPQLDVAV